MGWPCGPTAAAPVGAVGRAAVWDFPFDPVHSSPPGTACSSIRRPGTVAVIHFQYNTYVSLTSTCRMEAGAAAENGGRSSSGSETGDGSCAATDAPTGDLLERPQDFRRDDGCAAGGERSGSGSHGMGREWDGSNRGKGITDI
ncbi:hypothetical protein GUJ93_ZPchr0009g1434 [Zizania palustris]|uniref:Uncharacterized protein n=1 Tax=Zizania palustris TaxID=103762 RepID=A0A8J5RRN5_ZIZPA|nr:hypothetical protein GUJ93_ZPchr0009g1434 [Zizania palustris]